MGLEGVVCNPIVSIQQECLHIAQNLETLNVEEGKKINQFVKLSRIVRLSSRQLFKQSFTAELNFCHLYKRIEINVLDISTNLF